MTDQLTPFEFGDQTIRTTVIDGEPWFAAHDVCNVLGYLNSRDAVRRHVPAQLAGVSRFPTPLSSSGFADLVVINEAGLYRLIMRSNAPRAAAFQAWVTEEVLPAIRRTGRYEVTPALPKSYAEALRELAATVEQRDAAEAKVVEQAPKVEAFETYLDADNAISMGACANQLQIGRNTMMRRLREAGVLQRDNRPYQRYAHHFKVVGQTYEASNETRATHTTYVKPSGVELIRRTLFGPGLRAIEGGASA